MTLTVTLTVAATLIATATAAGLTVIVITSVTVTATVTATATMTVTVLVSVNVTSLSSLARVRYYCATAASALLLYMESVRSVVFRPHTLRVQFQPAEAAVMISELYAAFVNVAFSNCSVVLQLLQVQVLYPLPLVSMISEISRDRTEFFVSQISALQLLYTLSSLGHS